MATLAGQTIANTYISLLKTSSNSPNLASGSTTERIVLSPDADATDRTPIYVSQDRVGIGTSSPTYTLDVETADNVVASFISTDDTAEIAIGDDADIAYFGMSDNGGYAAVGLAWVGFNSGESGNNLNVDANGNVGIGTQDPQSPLHITSAAEGLISDGNSNIPQLLVSGSGSTAGSSGPIICLHNSSEAVDNDYIGTVKFTGGDSGNASPGDPAQGETYAAVSARVIDETDASAAGAMYFNCQSNNAFSTAMTILGSSGSIYPNVGIGTDAPGAKLHVNQPANDEIITTEQDGGTFTTSHIVSNNDTIGGSGWNFCLGNANIASSLVAEYKIRGDGYGYFHASPVSTIDYAEYFESSDGKAISLGISVVLVDGKVRAANDGETPFGVVSSTTGSGCAELGWNERFLKDDYNDYIRDDSGNKKENPDFVENLDEDGKQIYIPRQERDEWNSIGLLGQVPITKGQPVASSWIKMSEISDSVDMYYIFPCAQVVN